MRCVMLLLLAVLPFASAAARAEPHVPSIGDRIRLTLVEPPRGSPLADSLAENSWLPGERFAGVLVGRDAAELRIDPDGATTARHVPLGWIDRTEFSRSRNRQTARGVVVGLLVGIAGGVWYASNNYSHQDPGNGFPSDAGMFGVAYGGGAGLVGAGLGGLFGSRFWSDDWAEVQDPPGSSK